MVTDVTQYRIVDTLLYLSAIKDLFKKAFEKAKDVTGLIVHSDQGFQYTSYDCHDMLPTVSAQISMSRRGNCYDNTSMEGFNCFPHVFYSTSSYDS